jgi:hypothetical protein
MRYQGRKVEEISRKEGRNEGRKEGQTEEGILRKKGRRDIKEGRKEGRKEGMTCTCANAPFVNKK